MQAFYIVLTKIRATLDLDEDQFFAAGILDAVCRSKGDINRAPGFDDDLAALESHFRRSGNDHPMFRATFMSLVTEPSFWQNLDTFNLVVGSFIQDRKASPGALIDNHK